MENGAPPKSGWAKLVPELLVTDIQTSLSFWRDVLGFEIAYHRLDDGFVYLERPEGAQIMLCARSGKWETATLEPPFGRGVMFQVYLDELKPILELLKNQPASIYAGPREVWRNVGDRQAGQQEVFVQDPDGYLIMMACDIGEKPLDDNHG